MFSLKYDKNLPLIFIIQLVGFWAVWRWLTFRVWTSGDEIWSLLALACGGFFCLTAGFGEIEKEKNPIFYGLSFAALFTIFYVLSFAFDAPPLIRAVLAITALTFTLSVWRCGKTFHFGIYALLLLSLPLVASLNFFLGYPMRLVVGKSAEFLLRLQGLDVVREGVSLKIGEKLIWIDAPCSGVKMLWFGFFLAAVLICFYRLKFLKSAIVFSAAFAIILLGNIFRATALFYIEAEIIKSPAWMHSAVGVLVFAFTAFGIASLVRGIQKARFPEFKNFFTFKNFETGNSIIAIILTTACAAAFLAPFLPTAETISHNQTSANFPTEIEGGKLKEIGLTEREKLFLEDFPGEIRRFSDGTREIIIRRVTEATRKLHPAEDCFKGIGYKTKPLPLKVDAKGKRHACFSAEKGLESLRICERIYDDSGNDWTDVSSWYWSALGKDTGEWWAITTAESLKRQK